MFSPPRRCYRLEALLSSVYRGAGTVYFGRKLGIASKKKERRRGEFAGWPKALQVWLNSNEWPSGIRKWTSCLDEICFTLPPSFGRSSFYSSYSWFFFVFFPRRLLLPHSFPPFSLTRSAVCWKAFSLSYSSFEFGVPARVIFGSHVR